MNDLPKINRNFLNLVSEEMQEEITRQTKEKPGPVFWTTVGLTALALVTVFALTYPIIKVLQ